MARKAVIIGTGISGILTGLLLKLAETGKDIDSIEVLNRRIDMAAFAINQKLKHAEDMVI
jgi:cation diffusion facilitator CzcD-associated flavoprotein CzcO